MLIKNQIHQHSFVCNMGGGSGVFSGFGILSIAMVVLGSIFFERWKQFVIIAIFVFLVTGKRYKFLYMVCKTLPRDVRAVAMFGLTLIQFYYWKYRGGGTARIFLGNVKRHPDKVAYYYQEETWTYQQVEDYSNQVANFFKAEGVQKGDCVGLLMENRPQLTFLWLGLCKLGAETALINNNQRDQVLSHSITAGHCKRIIVGTELASAFRDVQPDWPDLKVYTSGTKNANTIELANSKHLDALLPSSSRTALPAGYLDSVQMNDSFLLIYTSGTTGLPKAAKMTHARFFMMARGLFNMMRLRNDEVVYDTLPLYHTAGGLMGIGQVLLNGTTVVIRNKFSVSNFWTDCIKYKCTVAQYIGEMCRFLLASPERPEERAHNVRLIVGNGMRPQIWRAFVERFNIQQVGEFYGSTEGNCNMINTENTVGSVGFLPWFAPVLNPYYLIRADPNTNEPIRGEDGFYKESDYGEPGVLIGAVKKIHPFSQFTGYSDQKATEKKILRDVFKKGDIYFNSGDILVKDEFGFFYFKDRTGDTFRWRGENVATSEVEAVISNIVGLKDAIVYGVEIPQVEGRAGMAAIVDADNTLDIAQLAEGMKRSLPAYARPLFIRVLPSVPLTGTFKLKKLDLQNEGYNPSTLEDPLYFFQNSSYVPLTPELYEDIVSGRVKL